MIIDVWFTWWLYDCSLYFIILVSLFIAKKSSLKRMLTSKPVLWQNNIFANVLKIVVSYLKSTTFNTAGILKNVVGRTSSKIASEFIPMPEITIMVGNPPPTLLLASVVKKWRATPALGKNNNKHRSLLSLPCPPSNPYSRSAFIHPSPQSALGLLHDPSLIPRIHYVLSFLIYLYPFITYLWG